MHNNQISKHCYKCTVLNVISSSWDNKVSQKYEPPWLVCLTLNKQISSQLARVCNEKLTAKLQVKIFIATTLSVF